MIDRVCTPPPSRASVTARLGGAEEPSRPRAGVRSSTGRPGWTRARQRISSASRLPMPATTCWSSRRALSGADPPRQGRLELRGGDRRGVGAQTVDGRVEGDATQPTRVDQQQAAAVREGQGEPRPAVVAGHAAALPVVAAVDLAAVDVGDDDLPGHAEANAQRRAVGRRCRTTATCPGGARRSVGGRAGATGSRLADGAGTRSRRCRRPRRSGGPSAARSMTERAATHLGKLRHSRA